MRECYIHNRHIYVYIHILYIAHSQGSVLLKDELKELEHYVLLPEAVWCKFILWYGLADGSRPIGRKVIEWGIPATFQYLTVSKVSRQSNILYL